MYITVKKSNIRYPSKLFSILCQCILVNHTVYPSKLSVNPCILFLDLSFSVRISQ